MTEPITHPGLRMTPVVRRRIAGVVTSGALVVAALAVGGIAVAGLETAGMANASTTFLLAVVAVAVLRGTGPAITTAIGSFLVYDFFFVEPIHTLTVHDPTEWLNLLLLLVVGVVVGQLAGRERERAVIAIEGRREATALFGVSFTLATEPTVASALRPIAELVRRETRASRAWITVAEVVAADTAGAPGVRDTGPTVVATLRRRPGEAPAEWVRVHVAGRPPRTGPSGGEVVYRVAIGAGARSLGWLNTSRDRDLGDPEAGETRVMAAAADQVGQALERDRLQREANAVEVSRRSDALKSALLDSVSHDLRTPLASIRAAAGSLMDPEVDWSQAQRREIAGSIDREADWLNRLVTNLLDMSRIEAGELKPSLAVYDLASLVAETLARASAGSPSVGPVERAIPDDLPPVDADEVFLGQIITNTVDNARKYAGPDAKVRISAAALDDDRVRLTIEDSGPGVPADALPRLFEKFYRVSRRGEGSRRGTGIGLAVVRGLAEAMGGSADARPSELGGLAIEIDLPSAPRSPAFPPAASPILPHPP